MIARCRHCRARTQVTGWRRALCRLGFRPICWFCQHVNHERTSH